MSFSDVFCNPTSFMIFIEYDSFVCTFFIQPAQSICSKTSLGLGASAASGIVSVVELQ